MNRVELQKLSKSQLKGNWITPILITLIYSAIVLIVSLVEEFSASSLLSILGTIINLGIGIWAFIAFPQLYLRLVDNQRVSFGDVKVNKSLFLKSLGLNLLIGVVGGIIAAIAMAVLFSVGTSALDPLMISIFLLIIIVPLMIFSLAIALVPYILIEKDYIGIIESISLSMEMMKGYKWKLFVLYLSFIGWAILCIVTLGIGFLWVSPYIGVTTTNFYKYLDKEYNKQNSTN